MLVSDIQQNDSYMYIYNFSYYFQLWFITRYWISLSVLYSRTLFWRVAFLNIYIHIYFKIWFICSVVQLCLSLCNPMDCNPPDFPVHGIFQARILMWIAISSQGSSWPRDQTRVSCVLRIGRQILYHWAWWEAPNFIYLLLAAPLACRILVPQPGIKPILLALGAQSLTYWTARKVLTVRPCCLSIP